jgi:hypothetical protein
MNAKKLVEFKAASNEQFYIAVKRACEFYERELRVKNYGNFTKSFIY